MSAFVVAQFLADLASPSPFRSRVSRVSPTPERTPRRWSTGVFRFRRREARALRGLLRLRHEHRRTEIGSHIPASVHHDTAEAVRVHRAVTPTAHYAHPDRFVRLSTRPALPEGPWFNQPTREGAIQNA